MLARSRITAVFAGGVVCFGIVVASAYGTPPTMAPWVYIGEDGYRTEYPRIDEVFPRVEDVQTPASEEEQKEVVEGAVQTVDNAAEDVVDTAEAASEAVVPPPPPQDILSAAGAFAGNVVRAIAGAAGAVFGLLF